jgi:outer membrane murein-binding lipoprotein Lpp
MFNFRRLLLTIILCVAFATHPAAAQTNLTQILDTITNPDGTLFNGTVMVSWNGSSSSGIGTISPVTSSTPVYSGALSVLLVPTTTAPNGTYYVVVYNSSNGLVTWSETWQVPPSATPLTVSQVRQSSTKGSGPGGGSVGGTQFATIPVAISQITGLSTDLSTINTSLAALNSQIAALTAQVNAGGSGGSLTALQSQVNALSTNVTALSASVAGNTASISTITTGLNTVTATVSSNGVLLNTLNTSVIALNSSVTNLANTVNAFSAGGSNAMYVDAETPGGLINGTNTIFSLAQPPTLGSLLLYRNGLLQLSVQNYTLAGTTVTFTTSPASSDRLEAYYRISGASSSIAVLTDGEIPGGIINGVNQFFTLATAPNPVNSLRLYKNGLLLSPGNDFNLAGLTISFVLAATPQAGDTLQASYRH